MEKMTHSFNEPLGKGKMTPLGPSDLAPNFKNELAKCQCNEDLFEMVEKRSNWRQANPDALAEVEARGLLATYREWRNNQD